MSEATKLTITTEGPLAKELIEEFWAWYPDAGGEQDFNQSLDVNTDWLLSTECKDGEWFIQVKENNDN